MAKFKPARQKTKKTSSPGAVPCVILILTGMILISLLFYLVLRSGIK